MGGIFELDDVAGRDRVEDVADVVVVGSGVAGATVARVLSGAGVDVVIVEEGPRVRPERLRCAAWTSFRELWRDAGFQVARGRAMIPVLQGCAVGGSTVINGAIIHRIPPPIHADWVRAGAIDELLAHRELQRVWDLMDAELSVAPTPEEALGGNGRTLRAGVEAIGAVGHPIARCVRGCEGAGRCVQGCPTGRKQSMDVTYLPRAVEAGARVYATAEARRVLSRGGRAVGVVGRFRRGARRGPELRVHARHAVVLAASAVHTPLLLQRSGVGGRFGLVGRRFQAHPGASVLAEFAEPVRMWSGGTQSYETTHFWDQRMKFESVGVPLEVGAARVPGFGARWVRRLADYGHLAQWGVQVRARAHGSIRLRLGRAAIRYDLTAADVQCFKRGVELLVQMAFAAGATAAYPGVYGLPERIEGVDGVGGIHDLPDDPRIFHYIMSHMFGTAAMHPDPRRGVVGTDGQCHDLPGLFVADSSVFPTNLGVNPQHTIGAVAWRIAERLAERIAG